MSAINGAQKKWREAGNRSPKSQLSSGQFEGEKGNPFVASLLADDDRSKGKLLSGASPDANLYHLLFAHLPAIEIG